MPRKEEDSLGQDFTRTGEPESPKPPESQRSLGDQSTYGDAGSSVSDVGGLDDAFESDMEVVDLSDRYEIEDVIGKGGMGEVLRARDKRLNRPVAIKRILGQMARSKKALDRFLTEAQSVAALNHFNIVQIYDYGRAADGPFIIMELVEGQSLQDKLKEGPLELKAAVEMTCQLCDALSTAHEAGIIHRDIKPANILLTQRGEAKLTDFGLARQDTADHGQTMAGAVLGTIDFMPPEQRQDATQTDARSDLWSLAATLYQMVTGEPPRVIDLDTVPQQLRQILAKALKSKKDDRYQTAAEFREELRATLASPATHHSQFAVTGELAKGQCSGCGSISEPSRKFCEACGETLRSPCPKCEQEIAVWETFCSECGVNLAEGIENKQAELEQQKEQIESLRREYDYEQALALVIPIKGLSDARFKGHQVWAEEIFQTLETEHAEQRTQRDNVVAEAQRALENHRYQEVPKLLDEIPGPLRDDLVTSLLRKAQSRQQETQELLAEIKQRIASRDVDGLWEQTSRFLKLNPGHKQVSDLDQKLQERRQKRAEQTTVLLERAEAAYASHNDKEALGLLAKWPPGVKQPDRVGQLMELAQARDEQAVNLRQEIQTAVTAKALDGVLPKVEEYATLRPNDDSVAQLREQLLGYEESKPPDIIVTKEVSDSPETGNGGKTIPYLEVLQKYSEFSGRARRSEFWTFYLCNSIVSFVLLFITVTFMDGSLGNFHGSSDFFNLFITVNIVFILAIVVPSFAVTVRRLHDINFSGFWSFLMLVPYIGWLIVFVLCCRDSTKDDNQYGPNPKKANRPVTGNGGKGSQRNRNILLLVGGVGGIALLVFLFVKFFLWPLPTTSSNEPQQEERRKEKVEKQARIDGVPKDTSTPEKLLAAYFDARSIDERLLYVADRDKNEAELRKSTKDKDWDNPTKFSLISVDEVSRNETKVIFSLYYWTIWEVILKKEEGNFSFDNSTQKINQGLKIAGLKEFSRVDVGRFLSNPSAYSDKIVRLDGLKLISSPQDVLEDANGYKLGRLAVTEKNDRSGLHKNTVYLDTARFPKLEKGDVASFIATVKILDGKQWISLVEMIEGSYEPAPTSSNEPQEMESGPAENPETPLPTADTIPTDKPALAAAPLTESQANHYQADWAEYLDTPVDMTSDSGVKFVLIPPGEFQMGSPASEAGRDDDETQHRVQITKPFYLSVHEVTQEQYQRVMGTNPSYFSDLGEGKSYVSGLDTSQFPVENMSWNDAVNFCGKLKKKEGGVKYRLPTEAEWEYACRAGTTTAYSSGPGTSELDAIGWYGDNSGKAAIDSASIWETDQENYVTRIFGNGCRPHVVGGKSPNAWGLYDMHGNVYEWCRDWYADYGNGEVRDPTGPGSGERRVLRGGSFLFQPRYVRSADRLVSLPDNRNLSSGFRLARTYNLSP